MDLLRAVHEAQQQKQHTAFQELEAECRSAQVERDALQDRFEGEWLRFGGRADQHVASLSEGMKGRAPMCGRRWTASYRVVTPMGRVLTKQVRWQASAERKATRT